MRVRNTLGAVVAVAILPASAQAAPTLQTDKPCYTPDEPITFTGAGYTPGGEVGFVFSLMGENGSKLLAARDPVIADANGAIRSVFNAPRLASSDDTREQIFTSASDQARLADGAPPVAPEETFGVSQVELSIFDVWVDEWERGGRGDARGKTKITAYGYEPATKLWAHYVLKGKRVKTVEIGALKGPCGDLTKTIRQFPFRPVAPGTYSIYFQGSRTLDKSLGTPYRRVRVR
jgi:hypothetical protein